MKRTGYLAVFLSLLLTPASGAVRALVVGINDYGGLGDLNSCVADARDFANLLGRTYGVPAGNIRLLLDGEASREGIAVAFQQHLVSGASADDQIVFYFSGHGSLSPNLNSITLRRVDKALVPARLPAQPNSWAHLVTQASLDEWLAKSPARRQVVVLDCCHSGTQTRGLSGDSRVKGLDLGFSAAETALSQSGFPKSFVKSSPGKSLLWLGACQSTQVSYTGSPNSLFTGRLLRSLSGRPSATIDSVFPEIARDVTNSSQGLISGKQEPLAEGPTSEPLLLASVPVSSVAVSSIPSPASAPDPTATAPSPVIIPPPSNPFTVSVALNKSVYLTNELPVVTVRTSEDAYLRVFIIDASARMTQIFPNKWQTDNRVSRGAALRLPAEGETRWRLRTTLPFGNEIVLVQARREQFPDLAKGVEYSDLFMDLGQESPAQSRARGMLAEETPTPVPSGSVATPTPGPIPNGRAEALVTYQVVPSRS
jgi:hypothetical protein